MIVEADPLSTAAAAATRPATRAAPAAGEAVSDCDGGVRDASAGRGGALRGEEATMAADAVAGTTAAVTGEAGSCHSGTALPHATDVAGPLAEAALPPTSSSGACAAAMAAVAMSDASDLSPIMGPSERHHRLCQRLPPCAPEAFAAAATALEERPSGGMPALVEEAAAEASCVGEWSPILGKVGLVWCEGHARRTCLCLCL